MAEVRHAGIGQLLMCQTLEYLLQLVKLVKRGLEVASFRARTPTKRYSLVQDIAYCGIWSMIVGIGSGEWLWWTPI